MKLHVFPNPKKEPERFRIWLYAIGGDILALDNNFIHDNRRVCHSHFEPQYNTWSGRLSENAVPTLNLPGIYKHCITYFIWYTWKSCAGPGHSKNAPAACLTNCSFIHLSLKLLNFAVESLM